MEKTKIIALALLLVILLIAILTSKFKTRKQYEISKIMRLFPHWMKYIGTAIFVISTVFHWINELREQSAISSFWHFGITIGLLVVCLSKEKIEDEMTMYIRLNAVFLSFFGGIMAHMIIILIEKLYGSTTSYNSLYVTTYILILYIIYFYFKKNSVHE